MPSFEVCILDLFTRRRRRRRRRRGRRRWWHDMNSCAALVDTVKMLSQKAEEWLVSLFMMLTAKFIMYIKVSLIQQHINIGAILSYRWDITLYGELDEVNTIGWGNCWQQFRTQYNVMLSTQKCNYMSKARLEIPPSMSKKINICSLKQVHWLRFQSLNSKHWATNSDLNFIKDSHHKNSRFSFEMVGCLLSDSIFN